MSLDDALPLDELKEGYLYELEQTRSGGVVGIFRGIWFETYNDDSFYGQPHLDGHARLASGRDVLAGSGDRVGPRLQ